MSLVATFYAAGTPRPQGSKRGFVQGGQVRLVESGGVKHKDWRATVAHAAHDAMDGRAPVAGPLSVAMTFHLSRPKSHPKTRRTWPVKRPDCDKLVRSVADSLTHVVWKDDSQIVELVARKCWAYNTGPQAPDATGWAPGPGVTVWVRSCEVQP